MILKKENNLSNNNFINTNKQNHSSWLSWGVCFCCLGVLLGAFGAHGLKGILTQNSLTIFETAVKYQMYHGFALICLGLFSIACENIWIYKAGWCFVFGIFIFSGSLYLLAVTDIKWLGAITPVGGVLLIIGWIFFFLASGAIARFK